jgi:hypothetical protein
MFQIVLVTTRFIIMKKLPIILGIIALSAPLSASFADEKSFAIGAIGGTRGVGFEGTFGLSKSFNVRGSFAQYDFSEDYEEDGINYSGDLELNTTGILLDYYPFEGTFRLSAGYFNNGSKLAALAEPGNDGTVEINGYNYDVSGEWVQSDMDWDGGAPYVGFGWGNSLGEGSNWTLTLDVGILLTDSPTARLTASDGLYVAADAVGRDLDADLRAEEQSLNDGDLSDFDKYPVIQIGINYAF